ncbi:MAG: sulfite exporter TauE/SafE family protein [Candidatus Omnitrophota bacterium]
MSNELFILLTTAVSVGFIHTLLGPDHYLPFIVMAKARRWSYLKTTLITFVCGLGHVASSVLIGLVGLQLGFALNKLEFFESLRGNWAGWGLIIFGFSYFVYGVFRVIKNKPHTHSHFHLDGNKHMHEHTHKGEHVHVHQQTIFSKTIPWTLFVIFVFGPCEPLIPVLMYPALKQNLANMFLIAIVFGLSTISTMIGIVLVSTFGINILPIKPLEKYSHAFAGFIIFFCGLAVQFFGL